MAEPTKQKEVTKEIFLQMLKEPLVQEALRSSDVKAILLSERVKAQLQRTSQERFPTYAPCLREARYSSFVNHPEVQALTLQCLGWPCDGAEGVLVIQQGPAGVRLMAMIAGLLSSLIAVFLMLDFVSILTGPVFYILNAYKVVFGVSAALFEVKLEWVEKVNTLSRFQDLLLDKAGFLAGTLGRGLLWLFLGLMWIAVPGNLALLEVICWAVGAYMVFVGALSITIHFGGYTNQQEKRRRTEPPLT